eukprot:sb/3467468/
MSLHVVNEGGTVDTIVDTGTLYDNTCRGGRIGVFSQRQWGAIFANVRAYCLSPLNYAAQFEGSKRIRIGGLLEELGVTRSFQISAWFRISDYPTIDGIYPILCRDTTTNQPLCLFINSGGKVVASYGSQTIVTDLTVTKNTWTLAVLQYDMQQKELRVYGTDKGEAAFNLIGRETHVDIPPEHSDGGLALGSDGVNYFEGDWGPIGLIDEVRVFKRLLTPSLLQQYLLDTVSLEWENKMVLVSLHLTFDIAAGQEVEDVVELNVEDILGNVDVSCSDGDEIQSRNRIRKYWYLIG